MRMKIRTARPEAALTRLLEALEQDLLDASDEEVMQAAKDLGMDPTMKGSAAFAGIRYRTKPRLSDFFDLDRSLPESRRTALPPRHKDPNDE